MAKPEPARRRTRRRPRVAILGGGLSGGAVAYHLAQARPDLDITVVEPRAELGRGLPYATGTPRIASTFPRRR